MAETAIDRQSDAEWIAALRGAAGATLVDVVNHCDAVFALGLSGSESADLVEYLKSL